MNPLLFSLASQNIQLDFLHNKKLGKTIISITNSNFTTENKLLQYLKSSHFQNQIEEKMCLEHDSP